jgi:hypothetical protein
MKRIGRINLRQHHCPHLAAVWRIRDVYPGSRIPDPDFYPSRILDLGFRIPDPGSWISDSGSRIPDPKTVTKERGEKVVIILFFVVTNFTKLNIMLFLKC